MINKRKNVSIAESIQIVMLKVKCANLEHVFTKRLILDRNVLEIVIANQTIAQTCFAGVIRKLEKLVLLTTNASMETSVRINFVEVQCTLINTSQKQKMIIR